MILQANLLELLSGSKGSQRFWDVCMNVISYAQLVIKENGKQIQKGMNFAIQKTYSVVLMSTQKNAPYNDQIFNDGVIEYEGHDVPANINPEKKLVDQSLLSPSGTPTENGKFFQAALDLIHFNGLISRFDWIDLIN